MPRQAHPKKKNTTTTSGSRPKPRRPVAARAIRTGYYPHLAKTGRAFCCSAIEEFPPRYQTRKKLSATMAAIDEFVLWARHSQYADWWDRGDSPGLKPFPTLDIKRDECLNADFVFLCSEMGRTTGNEGGSWESVVYVKMDGDSEGGSEDGEGGDRAGEGDGEGEEEEGVRLPRKVYIVDEEGVFHEAEEWVDEEVADGNVEEEEDAELAPEEASTNAAGAAPPVIKKEFMWVHDDDWESLGFPPKKKLGRSRYRYYVNGMDPVR